MFGSSCRKMQALCASIVPRLFHATSAGAAADSTQRARRTQRRRGTGGAVGSRRLWQERFSSSAKSECYQGGTEPAILAADGRRFRNHGGRRNIGLRIVL